MTNTSFTELHRTLLELLNEAELRKGKYVEGMSFSGHSVHCIEDAHRPLRAKQNGRAASDRLHRLTATQVAGPERLVLEAASACPALSAHRSVVLSTSGTFLPLGQSCVYFQGTVFFPGPSWPPSEGFWQRSTLHKRPGHSSCLSLIPSVSSC